MLANFTFISDESCQYHEISSECLFVLGMILAVRADIGETVKVEFKGYGARK